MAEQAIRLTRAQAIRIVREAAARVPRDIQYPWACICCGRTSREVFDCIHAADCPIGAIKAQLSEDEYRPSTSTKDSEATGDEDQNEEAPRSLWSSR